MQHLDEGTIHSWLDGALSADEAARVEAHVTECPQCASAVAEARGFIAASSRILTALDHAPRGVVPIAAPTRRINPLVWRVAATVLVVAGVSLVVVQNRPSADTMMSARAKTELPVVTEPIAAADQASPQTAVSEAPAALPRRPAIQSPRPEVTAGEKKTLAEGGLTRAGKTAGVSGYAGAAPTPTAPTVAAATAARSRLTDVAAMDASTERDELKVVGTPRRIGAKVTLYEVAPGDTVTLTESIPSYLSSVVVTGAAVPTAQATGAMQKSAAAPSKARADAATANARESQGAGGVAAAAPTVSAPAPSAQTEAANTLNTITWSDPATGSTLSLTGRMPQSRLQAIRIRIEQERAAAAKKNP